MTSTRVELFTKYGEGLDTFVETGTYKGDGVAAALEAGFSRIVSFEISPKHYEDAEKRLRAPVKEGRVELYNKSTTGDTFQTVVQNLQGPALFWLDAHRMDSKGKDPSSYPLACEVNLIRKRSPHCHVILMDDVRLFERYGVSEKFLQEQIRKIHPGYIFEYGTSKEGYTDDVLCAYVPESLR